MPAFNCFVCFFFFFGSVLFRFNCFVLFFFSLSFKRKITKCIFKKLTLEGGGGGGGGGVGGSHTSYNVVM